MVSSISLIFVMLWVLFYLVCNNDVSLNLSLSRNFGVCIYNWLWGLNFNVMVHVLIDVNLD